jgi:hypothetical protein
MAVPMLPLARIENDDPMWIWSHAERLLPEILPNPRTDTQLAKFANPITESLVAADRTPPTIDRPDPALQKLLTDRELPISAGE